MGPGIRVSTPEEVLDAVQRLPPDLPWDSVADRILPMLPRVRPWPAGYPAGLETIVAPGVAVGFAIDVGPGFLTVTGPMLEEWSRSLADLTAQALANVHALAALVGPSAIYRSTLGGVPVEILQTGAHIGSTLILAPSELTRLFGTSSRTFIAPMRDVILALPADVEPAFAAWVFSEIAEQDPNHLWPRAYRFDGRCISVAPLAPDDVGQAVAHA